MNPVNGAAFLPLITAQNSGLNAIATANQRLNDDAQQIANPNSPDLTPPLVDLNQALVLAEAWCRLAEGERHFGRVA